MKWFIIAFGGILFLQMAIHIYNKHTVPNDYATLRALGIFFGSGIAHGLVEAVANLMDRKVLHEKNRPGGHEEVFGGNSPEVEG